ncbi:hypothetical protein ACHAW6_012026 [Cyclotella cf. meneghiniana]
MMQEYPSPKKPWSPQAPSMHSNAVILQRHGRNGTIVLTIKKHGPTGKFIDLKRSMKTEPFNTSPATFFKLTQQLKMNCQKNGYIARQPCKCCSSKNDTIKKLIDINKQQQETIHNLQAQNGELRTLLKRLSESSITNHKPATIWDPRGYTS